MSNEEGISKKIEQAFEKTKRRIDKLHDEFKHEEIEGYKFSEKWFRTSSGKKLVKQIEEIFGLNIKILFLSFPQKEFYTKLIGFFKDDEIKKEIIKLEGNSDEETEKFANFIGEYSSIFQEGLQVNSDDSTSFTEKELQISCATFTLSLYAYIDNYCKSIIVKMLKNAYLNELIKINLEKERRVSLNDLDEKKLEERITRLFPTSPLGKIKTILKYLRLDRKVAYMRKNYSLEIFHDLFDGFVKIRNKLAHSEPVLTPKKIQTHKVIYKRANMYGKIFTEMISSMDFEKAPEFTIPLTEMMKEWFIELTMPISAIYTFYEASFVYVAIFDQVIGEILQAKL